MTAKNDTPTTAATRERRRPRPNAVLVELTDSERQKLEWLKENRGERATLVSTIRELIMGARK